MTYCGTINEIFRRYENYRSKCNIHYVYYAHIQTDRQTDRETDQQAHGKTERQRDW